MKILQVSKLYFPWIGGVEKIAQQIAEGLNGRGGLEVEVLCCQPKGKREAEEVRGVQVQRASSFGVFWGMPLSLDFFQLLKKALVGVDIIDFHHPFPLGDLAVFLLRPGARLIVHYHSDIVRQRALDFMIRPLVLSTLKRAEKILVSNPNLMRNSPYLKKFQEKCEVIPFGVDFEEIERVSNGREVNNIKKKYGDFVLFVGRLSYYKGVRYLIKAMGSVRANLLIIGEGDQEDVLRRDVEELGIKNRVFFLPSQSRGKLISFYKAAKVLVLPSVFKSEAFGIVLAEAMACGTPVISTELGTGTSWVNKDKKTGFVVTPRNSEALAEAAKKVLEDRNLACKMGRAAAVRAREELSLRKMLQKVSEAYRSL